MIAATSDQPGASLGLAYGRRRQGKTLLLESLALELGGFMFAATQQSQAQNLADLGAAYASYLGRRQPVVFVATEDSCSQATPATSAHDREGLCA